MREKIHTMNKSYEILTAYFTQLIAASPPGKEPKIGERQAATLLFQALSEGIIDRPSYWNKNKLKQSTKRSAYRKYLTWRSENNKKLSTHLDLSNFLVYRYQDTFSRICVQEGKAGWNLVGQKDDPVLLILKDNDKPLFPGEENKVKKMVPGDLKYGQIHYLSCRQDVDKSLTDVKTTGGGKEAINSYFHTYHLHPENINPPMINKKSLTKIWGSQKIISLVKRIAFREGENFNEKIKRAWIAVRDLETDRRQLLKDLARVYFSAVDSNYHTKEDYYNDQLVLDLFCRKEQIFGIELPSTLELDLEMELEDSQKFLESLLKRMIQNLIPELINVDTLHDLDSSLFSIPSVLIEEWKKSPKHPSQLFTKRWLEFGYDPAKVSQYFVSPVSGIDHLLSFPEMKEKVCLKPQRGAEWLEFYSQRFNQGNNSLRPITDNMTSGEILNARYNLIRGNIAETWVLDYIQKHQTEEGELAQIGMITDETRFYSPDGLLVKGKTIVPVEIKTIIGTPSLSSSFLRDYDLARLQLRGVAEIINRQSNSSHGDNSIAKKGLGYFLFIHFNRETKAWDFDLRKVVYDLLD
jgi:hypothetical protein